MNLKVMLWGILAWCLGFGAHAQTDRTWDDGHASDDFDQKNNWSDNDLPNSASERARFNANGLTKSIDVDGSVALGGIIFTSNLTDTIDFFDSNTLTLDSYGIINQSNTTPVFANNMALSSNQAWSVTSASGGLSFTGGVDLSSHTLTLTPTNASNTLTFNGVIAGTGGLTQTGAGLTLLGGANTYTGATIINGGTLRTTASERIANGSNLTIAAGATFEMAGGIGTETVGALSGAGDIKLNWSNTFVTNTSSNSTFSGSILSGYNTFRKDGSGDLTLSGNNLYSGLTYIDGGTLIAASNSALGSSTYGNVIANGATLGLQGGITLTEGSFTVQGTGDGGTGAIHNISGNNTLNATLNLAGATTISSTAGTLTLGTLSVGSNLTFGGAGNTTIDGQMYGGSGVTKNGTGTLTYAGGASSNSYSGATNVNDGVLLLSKNDGTTAIGSSSTLTIGDGSGSAGSAIVRLGNHNQIADSTPTVAIASDGRLDLNNYNEGFNTVSGSGQITLGSGTLSLGVNSGSSSYAGVISGTGNLTKAGSGTVTLSGANTYTGATNVTGGTLTLGASNVLSNTTAVDVSGSTTFNVNNHSDTVGSIAGAGNITLGSGTLTNGGNNTSTSFTGVISGTGNLVQSGSGTLTLSGANTYSGNTTVNSGSTLVLASNNALGSGGATTVNSGGTLALQGNITDSNQTSVTIAGTGVGGVGAIQNRSGDNLLDANITLSGSATIASDSGTLTVGSTTSYFPANKTITLGASTLTFETDGGNITLGASITGSGSVVKTGSGTLLLENGINSFTGTTSINDGTLVLNTYEYDITYPTEYGLESDLVIGDGIGAANSAVFQQGSSEAPGTSNEYIKDSKNVTVNSDGYWNLRGYKETINNLTLNGGTIDAKKSVGTADRLDVTGVITAGNATTSTINGLLGMNNDAAKSIVVGAGSTLDINALLSNGGFVKTGSGTLELSGANTFTGVAQIDAGIVRVNNNNGLGATAGKTIVSGTGAQLRLENVTIGAESLDLAGTGISGDGALRSHSGANTWGGSIAMTGNAEIETASGSSLIVTGGITGSGTTLTVESIGTTTFNGVNTFGTLNKTGAGTLTVTNTNTYGTANISAGTFALGASNILSNTMDLNVTGTGNFNVGTHTETIDDLVGSGTLTVAGSGNLTIDKLGGTLSGGNPTGAFTGTLDVDGIMTLNGGTIGTGADGSGSTGSMILTAGNTLTIAGDFNFGGTLQLGSSGTGANLALSGAGTTFDLGALHVIGASSIDFSGVDATTLNLGNLTFDAGATLTVTGWESFSDLWTSTLFPGAVIDTRNATTAKITFSGFSNTDTIWLTYDYGANEITVPEPRSYGALLMAFALAAYATRRPRRHPETP